MQKSFLILLAVMSSNVSTPQAKPVDPVTVGLGIAALGTIGALGKYCWDLSSSAKATRTLTEAKSYLDGVNRHYYKELTLIEKGASSYELIHFIGSSISRISSEYTYNVAEVLRKLESHESAIRQEWSQFLSEESVDASRLSAALANARGYFKTLVITLDVESYFWPLCDARNSLKKGDDDLVIHLEQSSFDHALRIQFAHAPFPYLAAYRALEADREVIKSALFNFENGAIGKTLSPFHNQVYQDVKQRAHRIDAKYAFVIGNPEFQHEKEQSQHEAHMAEIVAIKRDEARAKEALAKAAQKQADEERRANDLRREALYEERRKNDYNAEVARQGRIFDSERDIWKQRVADEQWRNQQLQQRVVELQGIKAHLEYKLAEWEHYNYCK